jgi:hypothetical protein
MSRRVELVDHVTFATGVTIPPYPGRECVSRSADVLRLALDAREWLSPGEVAILLGVNRQTIHRMLSSDPPTIRYRLKPGSGQHRECNPDDVLRLLRDRNVIYGQADKD